MEVFDSPKISLDDRLSTNETHTSSPTGLSAAEIGYWIAFNRVLGIGPVNFRLILEAFHDDLAAAWRAESYELLQAGLYQKTVEAFLAQRGGIEPERECERLAKAGVNVLTWRDPAYPALLREIDAAPPVLYLKGALSEADQFALAVVGTRNADTSGVKSPRMSRTDSESIQMG